MLSLAPYGRRRLFSRLQEARQEAEHGGCTPSRPKGGEERGRVAHGKRLSKRLSKGGALRADRKGGEERGTGLLMGA